MWKLKGRSQLFGFAATVPGRHQSTPDDGLLKSLKNNRRAGRESLTLRHRFAEWDARSNKVSLRHFGLKDKNPPGTFPGRVRDNWDKCFLTFLRRSIPLLFYQNTPTVCYACVRNSLTESQFVFGCLLHWPRVPGLISLVGTDTDQIPWVDDYKASTIGTRLKNKPLSKTVTINTCAPHT